MELKDGQKECPLWSSTESIACSKEQCQWWLDRNCVVVVIANILENMSNALWRKNL